MEYTDKTITCQSCGTDFTFTAGEQEFYKSHNIENEPKSCKKCRDAKKARLGHNRRRDDR